MESANVTSLISVNARLMRANNVYRISRFDIREMRELRSRVSVERRCATT